ncbi:hypothetical protein ACH8E3_09555 [Paenibacillus sp. CMAA1364]
MRSDKYLIIYSILFMGYIGLILGTLVVEMYDPKDTFNPSVDILFLTLIPMLGFYFSRHAFKYLTEDSYTQMLIYLRTLPISPQVIMCYRYIQMLIAFAINGVIVFSIIYGFGRLGTGVSIGDYICFTLTWIGYALAVTGIYIHLEFTCSGKKYFWMSMVIMGASVIVGMTIQLFDGNLLLYTLRMSQEWGTRSPVMWGALLVGVISLALMRKLTIRRLQERDLL